MSLSAGTYSFASSANIYTWIVVILLAATTTFINDRNDGKHDKWYVLRGCKMMKFNPLFEKGENKDDFKKEFAEFRDKDGYIVGWYVVNKYWNIKV